MSECGAALIKIDMILKWDSQRWGKGLSWNSQAEIDISYKWFSHPPWGGPEVTLETGIIASTNEEMHEHPTWYLLSHLNLHFTHYLDICWCETLRLCSSSLCLCVYAYECVCMCLNVCKTEAFIGWCISCVCVFMHMSVCACVWMYVKQCLCVYA